MSTHDEIEGLRDLTVAELRERHAVVFGEPTTSRHKEYLRKRIAWRMQAIVEGGLTERARRRAEELADEADLRLLAPAARTVTGRLPVPCDESLADRKIHRPSGPVRRLDPASTDVTSAVLARSKRRDKPWTTQQRGLPASGRPARVGATADLP